VARPPLLAEGQAEPDDPDFADDDLCPGLGLFALLVIVVVLMLP
jgi:hypothetical protein